MRSTWLITVAAAGLLAGAGVGMAQDRMDSGPRGGTGTQMQERGGAERGGAERSREPGTTGQTPDREPGARQGPSRGEPSRTQDQAPRREPGARGEGPRQEPGTQGQAPRREGGPERRRGEEGTRQRDRMEERRGTTGERERMDRRGTTGERERAVEPRGERERGGRPGTMGAAPSGVNITTEQRSQIRTHLGQLRAGRVDRVDFNISVGATVPRTVVIRDLPPAIVRIVPRYRGYKYILVEDEIVIIHPRTLRIVAVIPV